jgi:V/A-type H+-transporting ATPase subunit C
LPIGGYALVAAYLKGSEAKTIGSEHIDQVARASSIEDILNITRNTDIGKYLEGVAAKTFDDFDSALWLYFSGCITSLRGLQPIPKDVTRLLEAYISKYDILNIKAVLQGLQSGKKARSIPVGIIFNCGLLDELFATENIDEVIGLLNRCRLGNYAALVGSYREDDGIKSTLIIEAALNTEYFINLLDVIRKVKDGSILRRVLGTTVDLINLQTVLRATITDNKTNIPESIIGGGYIISDRLNRELLSTPLTELAGKLENTPYYRILLDVISSYEINKNIAAIDEVIERNRFLLAKEMLSPHVLSLVAVLWYLIIKEVELRNLRLIIKGMLDNLSFNDTRRYLVTS